MLSVGTLQTTKVMLLFAFTTSNTRVVPSLYYGGFLTVSTYRVLGTGKGPKAKQQLCHSNCLVGWIRQGLVIEPNYRGSGRL
jgi:hypothetical protein